jgi:hypothetical protein
MNRETQEYLNKEKGEEKMKKPMITLTVLLLTSLILFPLEGRAQTGPGTMGPQGYNDWNYCPYCGAPLGPGGGYSMGPGMMGPRYGYGPQYQPPQKPLEEKDAKGMLENYLRSTRNPNLKLGKIEDKGPYFEAEILTKEGSLADKLAVDKNTGWMRSIY